MKKIYKQILPVIILTMLMLGNMTGKSFAGGLTGTFYIPATYQPAQPFHFSSIAEAIGSLNAVGVGTGGVTFAIQPGYTETFTAQFTGLIHPKVNVPTAANPVVFKNDGTPGINNPVITQTATSGITRPAGINVCGTSYITFDGLDVTINTPSTFSFCYALSRASATRGCQHITIRNCNIQDLTASANSQSYGIYQTSQDSTLNTGVANTTAATGANSFNSFYGNTINFYSPNTGALFFGILLQGPGTSIDLSVASNFPDNNNNVGVVGQNPNVITVGSSSDGGGYGINISSEQNLTIANNTIRTQAGNTGSLNGLFINNITSGTMAITNNDISFQTDYTTAGLGATMDGMYIQSAPLLLTIQNNYIHDCRTKNDPTQVALYGIYCYLFNNSLPATLNISGNTISNNKQLSTTVGTMGNYPAVFGGITMGLLGNSASSTNTFTTNIFNNIIANNISTVNELTGIDFLSAGSSAPTPTQLSTSPSSVHDNQIYNNSSPGTGTTAGNNVFGIRMGPIYSLVPTYNFNNNLIYNLSTSTTYETGTATVAGIYFPTVMGTASSDGTANIFGNTIGGLTGGSVAGGAQAPGTSKGNPAYGIYLSNQLTLIPTYNVYANKIYSLSGGGLSTTVSPAAGIYAYNVSGQSVNNIYNNFVADINATDAYGPAGIELQGTTQTTNKVYANSVYLNQSAGVTNASTFNSSGIYLNAATTGVDLVNNLVVNKTPAGTNSKTSALYVTSNGTMATTSNNNCYYGGGSANTIYNGTVGSVDISTFRTAAGWTGDAASISANPGFTSLVDLHTVNMTNPAPLAAGKTLASPYNVDIDGQSRTVPYIGADEASVAAAPVINSLLTASGTQGIMATDYYITATNSPGSFNATSLPPGLTINTTTGLISGTPTSSGTFNVAISATNNTGTSNKTLVYTILPRSVSLANGAVSTGSINQGTINNVLYQVNVTLNNTPAATLTAASFVTTGNYVPTTDITNLKLWYSTSSTFSAGTATLLQTITPTAAGTQAFNVLLQDFLAGTNYLFVTADAPSCITVPGNTISVAAITTSSLTFTGLTPTGSSFTAGGVQTITSAVLNVTAPTATASATGQVTLGWVAPASCYTEVMIVASPAANNGGAPTGNGTAYTDNLAYTNGTAFGNGYVVYKGTASPQSVTGLTNGTTYYFKFFTRQGSSWSSGIEISATPVAVNYFWNGGDMNANPAAGGSGAWDISTMLNWRAPSATGNISLWSAKNASVDAIFAGTAGIVTTPSAATTFTAPNFNFNSNGYSLWVSQAGAGVPAATLGGNIVLSNNVNLTVGVTGATSAASSLGNLFVNGNISGTGTAGLNFYGNGTGTSFFGLVLYLNAPGATVSVPVTFGNNLAGPGHAIEYGFLSNAVGATLSSASSITNSNIDESIMLGATAGNDLTINCPMTAINGTTGLGLDFNRNPTTGGTIYLNNNNNSVDGTTSIHMSPTGKIVWGADNVLPYNRPANGLTFGESASGTYGGTLDLNGHSQTIPYISTSTTVPSGGFINNAASTTSVITLTGSTSNTFYGTISDGASGTGKISIVRNGTGTTTLRLTTVTGDIVVNSGELIWVGTNAMNSLFLNGGNIGTTGISVNGTLTFNALTLTDNARIDLGTNLHTINFSDCSAITWTPGKIITIYGWVGTFGAGTTGTKGKVFFGSAATGLTSTQLSQIRFVSGTFAAPTGTYTAQMLSTGQIVPGVLVQPTVALSNGTVSPGNITQNTTSNVLYQVTANVSNAVAVLNTAVFNTAGNYAVADITTTTFKLWYSTVTPFNAATSTMVKAITPAVAGNQTFSALTQGLAIGTDYLYVTADMPCAATAGHTINVNAISTSSLTLANSIVPTGSGFTNGGVQTIITATPVDVTSPAVTLPVSPTQLSLSWTAPAICSSEILIIAAPASNTGVPTGDGTAYTGNVAYTSGTALGNGFVVYKGVGTGTPKVITGLTTGTQYFFKFYTRNGLLWSPGVEVSGTPLTPIFYWNGQTTTANPAAGGTGAMAAATANWRLQSNGPLVALNTNVSPFYDDVFPDVAGTVTITPSTFNASRFIFPASGVYTLKPSSTTALSLIGDIQLTHATAGGLIFTLVSGGSLTIGAASGGGDITRTGTGAILTIDGPGLNNGKSIISLAKPNATVSVPIALTSSGLSTNSYQGLIASATGVQLSSTASITNNTPSGTMATCIGTGSTLTYSISVNGPILAGSSPSNIIFVGNGTVTLNNNANTMNGASYMFNTGGVKLGIDNAVPTGQANSGIVFGGLNGTPVAALFDLNGFNQTIPFITSAAFGSVTVPIAASATAKITNNGAANSVSTLTINGSATTTFGLPITNGVNGGKIALAYQSTGSLTLSGINTYNGGTTINSGAIVLNAANNMAVDGPVTLAGGTLQTGATTGFTNAVGTLAVTNNSTIQLGTGSHTLTFASSSATSWTTGKLLTIYGWVGNYNTGASPTGGRIFVSNTSAGLTQVQLAQIRFNDGSVNYGAQILSSGEVVPTAITDYAVTTATYCAGNTVSVPYVAYGSFTGGNVFTAQLSDAVGTFASPVNIGTITSVTSGTISATIPGNQAAGTGYRIRVVGNIPVITGSNNGVDITINSAPVVTITPSSGSICANETLAQTASGAVSYTWLPVAGLDVTNSAAINAQPVVTTTYTIIGTDANNCTASATDVITVKTSPIISVNPISAVCTGNTNAVLTASGGATYTWSPSTNINATTGATITAQISQLTFYTVTGTGTNSCTANTVVPVATVATGGSVSPAYSIICSGGTQLLTVTNAAGNDYQWQISGDNSTWTPIVGATNTSYTTNTTDGNTNKYYRLLAQSNTCWNVASTSAEVDVSQPTINITTSALTDNSITLNWGPIGSGNYNISYNGASSGTALGVTPPKTITGLTANGNYTINLSQTGAGLGGCPATGTVNVTTSCAAPPVVNIIGTGTTSITLSWSGGAGNYRVYFRPLYAYNGYFTKDVINGTSTTLTIQGGTQLYSSVTYEIYVSKLDCPAPGNVGQPSAKVYATTTPALACTAPVIDNVQSICPVQIEVFMHGSPTNQYYIDVERLTPTIQPVTSYPVTGSYFTMNVSAGQNYLITARSICGGAVSNMTLYPNALQIKPQCANLSNLLLSNPTCGGFTASWNADQCIANNASYYQLFMRQVGTLTWNAYGVTIPPFPIGPYKVVSWLGGGKTYDVYARAVYSCSGYLTYGATTQTLRITTLSAGCRDEQGEPEEAKPLSQQTSADNSEVFSLYPNPNNGQFTIDLSRLNTNEDAVRIEVTNMLGQTVMTHLTSINDGHMTEFINLPSSTTSGTYIARVTAGKNVYTSKMSINK